MGGSANAGVCANAVDLAQWVNVVDSVSVEAVGTHALHVDVVSGQICSLIPCHNCGGDRGTLGLVTLCEEELNGQLAEKSVITSWFAWHYRTDPEF